MGAGGKVAAVLLCEVQSAVDLQSLVLPMVVWVLVTQPYWILAARKVAEAGLTRSLLVVLPFF